MTRGAPEDPADDRFSFSKAARFLSRICTQRKNVSDSRIKITNRDWEIVLWVESMAQNSSS
jgi:hypothetical protein